MTYQISRLALKHITRNGHTVATHIRESLSVEARSEAGALRQVKAMQSTIVAWVRK